MSKFKVGDRVVHAMHGEGVVIKRLEANSNGVPVVFDNGHTSSFSWGYLASPEFLQEGKPLIQENE